MFSDIGGDRVRDNISGGALTETTLLILLSLYEELHGYGVKLNVEKITNGRVVLGMGTLYGAIKNLLAKGWIEEASKIDGKINYIITDLGKEQVDIEELRLKTMQSIIKNIKGEAYEED